MWLYMVELDRKSGHQKTIRTSKVCVTLKTIWNYSTLINIKLRWVRVHEYPGRTLVIFKEHLVVFSLTFFVYDSKLSLRPNINFFIRKVYHFIYYAKRKTINGGRGGQTNHNKGMQKIFFSGYVEVTYLIQA